LVRREQKEDYRKRAYVKFSEEALDFLEKAWNEKPPRAESGYYQKLADQIGYGKEKIRVRKSLHHFFSKINIVILQRADHEGSLQDFSAKYCTAKSFGSKWEPNPC
jgi:hypothetical protein